LWICPVLRQRARRDTYHGYGIQNFLEVDERFGTTREDVVIVPVEPHRNQPLVHHVRAHLSMRAVHPLLDFVQERVDQPRPRTRHRQPPVAVAHPATHAARGVVGEAWLLLRVRGNVSFSLGRGGASDHTRTG
jgi:hypothetical protein